MIRAVPNESLAALSVPPLRAAQVSVPGRHGSNQDCVLSAKELGLFAVSDGIGGVPGGEVASRTVITALRSFFGDGTMDGGPHAVPEASTAPDTEIETLLSAAIGYANREVIRQQLGPLHRMGATVAGLFLRGDRAIAAHVGDSRIYRLRGADLTLLTSDHNLRNLLRTGSNAETPGGVGANLLTRWMGGEPLSSVPDLRAASVAAGDRFLVCSDGVSSFVPSASIVRALLSDEPEMACQGLLDAAEAAGSDDDVSAIVIAIDGEPAQPADDRRSGIAPRE